MLVQQHQTMPCVPCHSILTHPYFPPSGLRLSSEAPRRLCKGANTVGPKKFLRDVLTDVHRHEPQLRSLVPEPRDNHSAQIWVLPTSFVHIRSSAAEEQARQRSRSCWHIARQDILHITVREYLASAATSLFSGSLNVSPRRGGIELAEVNAEKIRAKADDAEGDDGEIPAELSRRCRR